MAHTASTDEDKKQLVLLAIIVPSKLSLDVSCMEILSDKKIQEASTIIACSARPCLPKASKSRLQCCRTLAPLPQGSGESAVSEGKIRET